MFLFINANTEKSGAKIIFFTRKAMLYMPDTYVYIGKSFHVRRISAF